MASVRFELARNVQLVEAELGALDRIISGSEHLLSQLNESEHSDFVVVADSVAWLGATWSPSLDASLGAVDALISSGRLSRVENPQLRLGLAGLRDLVVDASEEERVAQRLTLDQLYPLLQESMDLGPIRRVSAEFLLSGRQTGVGPQEQTTSRGMPTHGEVEFPNGAAVRGVLNHRLVWFEAAAAELERLPAHLESLIDQISDEIQ